MDLAASMQRTLNLNLKVKYRESFRPFAPSVPCENVANWFELDDDSPYMLVVADIVERRRRAMSEGEIDVLVVGNCFLRKEDQNPALRIDYRHTIHPD
jgi:carbamoyltransferase